MTKFFLAFIFLGFATSANETVFLENIEKKINTSLEDKIQLSIERDSLEQQIVELQTKIKGRKVLIIQRLKALYALNKFKWGELLNNSNLNDINRNIKILNNLNKYDLELFKDYNSSLKLLGVSRKNLQETELLIEENVKALQEQQTEFYRLEQAKISFLQKEKGDSLLLSKGQLSRPLEGIVKQEFGSLRDSHNQFYLINRGELYKAKPESAVKSIGLGKVIFRDVIARWRETLIIQHDDNYYSVYAGLKKSKKFVGDHVEKGELIGLSTGEEFYFELRHFDNPINPKNWYKE